MAPVHSAQVAPKWRARREGYRRLPAGRKFRRIRDRTDVDGMPRVSHERGKYGQYLYKGTEVALPKSNIAQRFAANVRREMPKFSATDIPLYSGYLAKRFSDELERSTIQGITEEMDKALKIVRSRAEAQLGKDIPETRSEHDYVIRLKAYVIKRVKISAVRWREELKMALPTTTPWTIWRTLIDKEYDVKNEATLSARTLLGTAYNNYMAYLLNRGGGKLYKWVNPLDTATSDVCRKIVDRSAGGVSLEQLKEIVKQEADSKWYRARNALLPHPNCRSSLLLIN